MLCISRSVGRAVWIGMDVTITMLEKLGSERWIVRIDKPANVYASGPTCTINQHIDQQIAADHNGKAMTTSIITIGTNESIKIGRGIKITLLPTNHADARLGIDAPRHLAVSRDDFSRDEHLAFQRERDTDYFPPRQ